MEQAHQRAGDQCAQCHDDQRRDQRQGYAVPHRCGQVLFLFCTEILRNHDARAGGNADEQHDQQVDDRAARADGGQRRIADIAADHNAVHCGVELLSQIADQQRDGKLHNVAHGAARRHVLYVEQRSEFGCHSVFHSP